MLHFDTIIVNIAGTPLPDAKKRKHVPLEGLTCTKPSRTVPIVETRLYFLTKLSLWDHVQSHASVIHCVSLHGAQFFISKTIIPKLVVFLWCIISARCNHSQKCCFILKHYSLQGSTHPLFPSFLPGFLYLDYGWNAQTAPPAQEETCKYGTLKACL